MKIEKQSQFLIAQRYTFERAMQLTGKVRVKCKEITEKIKENKASKVEETKVEEK